MSVIQVEPKASKGLDIESLVQEGRVHSRAFTDQSIFDMEMDKIFEQNWVYIGHGSEIPRHGDYRVRKIGRQSVVMIRDKDGSINVLMNRCRHRGAQVCEGDAGNTKALRCWFHGWIYDTAGNLIEVPGREAYDDKFNQAKMGLNSAPKVGVYRDFVFASLNPTSVELADHLGNAKEMIDLMVDASPTGAIRLQAGANRTTYKGNWKLIGMDGYHAPFVHASVVELWSQDQDRGLAATHRGNPFEDGGPSRTRDLGNGHSMLDFSQYRLGHLDAMKKLLRSFNGGEQYLADMYGKHSAERADLLVALGGDPHVGLFPNVQLINQHVRIINPIGPGLTEIYMTPVLLDGVSDEINGMRLRQHESFYGPAGAGSPDDTEIWERVQRGLSAEVNPWIDLTRGLHRQTRDDKGVITGHIGDEVTQRGQFRQWKKLMSSN
ncbi:aromatic ring-hydroxylating oxygenase subunit alpha [Ferribacterium limneticum]|uniref:aromatic ring-hydroxylating oxygenase subunit alpha n=1 Tax=Ferribacterium limneticum TaxID=76259 RepID=UPI001CFA1AC9|nr:Rieske 2Fe-2S domain-containing protein [Ferribacterium limneticum]UCV17753.1 Rieske 2Fe-2S domain-containing protein [Ferribacterium limneticum]